MDTRGIALPLALLGLIAVSVVAATAVVTSSSELALSSAHQGGVASVYSADGAIDSYIGAQAGLATPRLAPDTTLVNGDSIRIIVSQLTSLDSIPDASGDSAVRRESFAITGTYWNAATGRVGAGRRIGKLISTRRVVIGSNFNINAGATFGSNADITGNSLVSGVQNDTALCADTATVNAVTHASDVTVEYRDRNVDGEVVRDTLNSEELARHVLSGDSIMTLANAADVKFGALFGEPAFVNSNKPTSVKPEWPVGNRYNWGCPAKISDCEDNGGDRTYYPIVAIDAQGGEVGLQGDHGQGILIVVNGNLSITGNFTYQGIILVDGALDVRGTGGSSTKIQGAVIATGQVTLSRAGTTSDISGNAMIQYNSCEIDAAQGGLLQARLNTAPQAFQGRSIGWFEVVN